MKRNPLFVFVGIDGSGKTTLIKEVKEILKKKGKKTKKFYMGLGNKHYFLPLKWVMALRAKRNKKRVGSNDKALRDHNFRQRGFFWVFGQYCELWLRYLHAKRVSKNKIILFDRYFYDGLILGNNFTFNLFKYFTPKPTISFLVKAPPNLIRSRKNEAEVKHINEYYRRARRLNPYFNIIEVDNSKPLKEVVKKISDYVSKEI